MMSWWTSLGSWLTFALALSAFIFSALCFNMIRHMQSAIDSVWKHVMKFNPDAACPQLPILRKLESRVKELQNNVTDDN